jgi:LysM repeat protein
MRIHQVKDGECLQHILDTYSIKEETLRKTNSIDNGDPCVGEELLIQTPTRTYTSVFGDTVDRIGLRFGVRKRDIMAMNPWINSSSLNIGEDLTLKTSDVKRGMAVANGYFFKGCTREKLMRAMPYLTYVTFGSVKADGRGLRRIFDCSGEVITCIKNGKTPLLRVFDEYTDRYKRGVNMTEYAEALIGIAIEGGYKGIVIDACPLANSAKEFISFLMILRKMMIGCDLILITEINESSPLDFSEYADGSVFYYPRYAMNDPCDFKEGERRTIGRLATEGESAKMFIDLPSLARTDRGYITVNDAIDLARRQRCRIDTNKSTLLSHFTAGKQGECRYTSLSGINALLDLVNEFDYMGVSFDILRTPISYLMMLDSKFKTASSVTVRIREGCNRADGE